MISDKTLQTLEFGKILEHLQEYASFSAAREAIGRLRPAIDLVTAQRLQEQTREARDLLAAHPSVHLGGAHDVRGPVRRAEVGAILSPAELIDIGSTAGAARRFRGAVLAGEPELPWLQSRAEGMVEARGLVEALEHTFSDRGEVLDSASPALRRIRHEIATAQGRLMDRLQSMVSSSDLRPALQEAIITMRNGRYVIPVRAEARGKVPGIVHDQSASGQTVFVEPLALTEMNNRVKELHLAEQREVERILQELSGQVARLAPELRRTVEMLCDVDVALAKAHYAAALRASSPRLNDEGRINLVNARHPLLRGEVVPISLWLGIDFRVLVITGPNTGGKTVALKTAGLLTLMAQSGLQVPAAPESELAVFPRIFADIGDEQSIEQSLSTFSSHMRTIVGMLPRVGAGSLVLLDELGAGTDPAEGAALARAILTTLVESDARAVVTTHYSELKTFAHEQTGVENASVEFDVETLSPTYRLVIGLPGRSQALAIAKRLGMPPKVLSLARQHVSAGAVRVEQLLSRIQRERQEIGRLYEEAQLAHDDARKIRDRIQRQLAELQVERERVLAEAREEGAAVVRELRSRLRQIEEQARGLTSRRELRELRAQLEEAQGVAAERLGPGPAVTNAPAVQPLQEGAAVRVLSLGQQGTVLSLSHGEAEVQLGQFKMRLPVSDLEPLSRKERAPERSVQVEITRSAPPLELDMRGWRPDEATRELDQYLHDNYVHGQNTVRIVHGKGTGALRKAIRQQLGEHPLVKTFHAEKPELGGEGVTVVQLAG